MNGFERVLPFLIPVFFLGIWFLVLRIISLVSGWTQLAERFPHAGEFRGTLYHGQSARLRGANFNGILELGVGEEGMYLSLMVIFRPFHRPILVPWGEISAEPVSKFLFRGMGLTFRSFPDITLELSNRTFEKLKGHIGA